MIIYSFFEMIEKISTRRISLVFPLALNDLVISIKLRDDKQIIQIVPLLPSLHERVRNFRITMQLEMERHYFIARRITRLSPPKGWKFVKYSSKAIWKECKLFLTSIRRNGV